MDRALTSDVVALDQALGAAEAFLAELRAGPMPLWPELQRVADAGLDGLVAVARRPLHLVYTPGKVGSKTVKATLDHLLPNTEAIHVHWLGTFGFALLDALATTGRGSRAQIEMLRYHCRRARVLLDLNTAYRAAGVVTSLPTVLTGVRDPLAAFVSMVFEGHAIFCDVEPRDITPRFLRDRLRDQPWHLWSDEWYTRELGEVFGVDIFAREFPTERGWDIYESEAARVLLIRQEDLAQLPQALAAIYPVRPEDVMIRSTNRSAEKPYAGHYDAMRKRFRLSAAELDEVYGLPCLRHFYTPAQIAAFRSRWGGRRLVASDL